MKRALLIALAIFSSSLMLAAQDAAAAKDPNRGAPMTGWICSSKCVVHQGERASCDQSCTTGGDPVFVDEKGSVMKISKKANGMAKKNMGKHVTVMATMDDQEEIQRLELLSNNP